MYSENGKLTLKLGQTRLEGLSQNFWDATACPAFIMILASYSVMTRAHQALCYQSFGLESSRLGQEQGSHAVDSFPSKEAKLGLDFNEGCPRYRLDSTEDIGPGEISK